MRISVNLATRPFVELRPFFFRLRVIMALLAVAAIGLGFWVHAQKVKLARAEARMAEVQGQTRAVRDEQMRNESRMREPANAAVLERAHFLNALFLAKSFSWTAVMMDLENVLPAGVQVTSIEPQVTAEGDVIIRLRVAGDRDRAVQLVRNLERSRRFLAPRLSAETTQARETAAAGGFNRTATAAPTAPPGVEFEILANYNPVPAGEPYPRVKQVRQESETGIAPAGVTPSPHRAARPTPQRGQYPRGGIVLRPYVAPPRPNGATGAAPNTPRPGTQPATPPGGVR